MPKSKRSIDARILAALRRAGNSGISSPELALELKTSRPVIAARIKDLRSFGYEIDASPHKGYHLRNSPDLLLGDDLLSRLEFPRVIGRDIRVFQQTTSTNDVAEKLARDEVPEGITVFAEEQTAGRGRLGRKWVSPAGKGLWFSILLRPNIRPQAATSVMIAAAVAVCRAIRLQTDLNPEIKWPNDILIRGKKTAGILTEIHAELDKIKHLILGIGVDVNLDTHDLPPDLRKIATSLRMEAGRNIHRADLAVSILTELEVEYARLLAGKFEAIAAEWERQCMTLGRQVVIATGDRKIKGRAESLDRDGALLVRTEHGRLERATGGDVTLEKD